MSEEIIVRMPSVPELVAELPAVPTVTAPLPGEVVFTLPGGTIVVMPEIRADVFAAAALLVVSATEQQNRTVVPAVRAELVVSGRQVQSRSVTFTASARLSLADLSREPAFSAVAALVFAAVQQQRRLVDLAGAAGLSFSGRQVQSRSVTFGLSAALVAEALETQKRAPVFGAVADLEAPYTFDPGFPDSGMNKNSNYTLPSTNTWHTIPSWSIRSGFPDTVIVTNGIEVPDGVEVAISGQLTYGRNDQFSGGGMKMRVMAGSTQIGAVGSTPGNGAVAALTPFTWKNETGDTQLVTVQGNTNSQYYDRNVITGGTGSYLVLELVAPPVPLVTRAADGFDGTGALPADWATFGGGTLKRTGGVLDGTGTPSVPLSYAYWDTPMPSNTQVVRATVVWDGRDPEHSSCGLVVRANPYQDPVTNPGAQWGVQFSYTRGYMALLYEDYDASSGSISGAVLATGTVLETISKFPEGTRLELRAEDDVYTVKADGVQIMQGTVPASAIPYTNPYVGLLIQDDSAESGGGTAPGYLDDFEALTP